MVPRNSGISGGPTARHVYVVPAVKSFDTDGITY